ncbi:LssY C-terminal domain-containing protein [Vibrio hannami]|uniref:LssY C-terminal domain-containing protein n=1 Tax=Vibrio hannami TaxID=2717094 RepID=UPI00240F7353|nr:LssY C-terminal domain-containing protein [Vibrio hannami]MDG3088057.1 LssY C-terminal domain-containing protein [Vibrio hannami]
MAFQLPGTLSKRNHIRWWSVIPQGASIDEKMWFGAISYDDGLGIALHSGLITLLHTVEANVDKQRDYLARSVTDTDMWQGELKHIAKPEALDENHDYYTDGRMLIVRPTLSLAAEI